MDRPGDRYEWARFLVAKLERLSADSVWAHRASGLRGALLRNLADYEKRSSDDASAGDEVNDQNLEQFDRLIVSAFDILEKAAKEIPDPDQIGKLRPWSDR